MILNKQLIDRHDIMQLLGVSYDQVRRNEESWGIAAARVNLSKRCIKYRTSVVVRIFMSRGWIDPHHN